MATPDWALQAGQHDPAALTTSLVPPGARVHVTLAAPIGLQPLLEARGAVLVAAADAELVIGGPDDVSSGRPGIIAAPNLDHGAVVAGGAALPGAVGKATLDAAVAASGLPRLATVRTFAPFEAVGAAVGLQADPDAWVTWRAVLVGTPELAPPPARPAAIPKPCVLVLATDPFGTWDAARRRMLLALNDAVRDAGHTLVLSWNDLRLTGSLAAHVDLARVGIVLHGGDGVFDVEGASAAVAEPGARALVNAYQPEAVVVLDLDRADPLLAVGAAEVPRSRMFGVDHDSAPVEEGIQLPLVPRRIAEVLASPVPPGRPDIAVIEPRERQPGVTSIVIPVYGRWDLTSACLNSLRANTGPPIEIVVVDNASPDETRKRLAEQQDVTTITCSTNLGFAGGTNVGLQAATGEFVCLLNNDTEVVPGWLEALLAAIAVPGTGMVGPRSNSISGLQFVLDGPTMEDLDAARRWGLEQAAEGGDRTWKILRLVGFAMLLRGDLLEELGGLDQAVGLGNYEDDDLCQRIRRTGRTLRVADGSVVLHHGSATFLDADISALATARQGARHLGDRLDAWSDHVIARIVADADPEVVEFAVSTARMVADEIVVVCPGPTLPHAVRSSYVNCRAVHVVAGDPAQHTMPTRAQWALHLDARTPVDHLGWGRTRADVEALPRQVHRIEGLPGALLVPIDDGVVGPRPTVAADAPVTAAIRPARA